MSFNILIENNYESSHLIFKQSSINSIVFTIPKLGGLVVLGSIHADLVALLDDKTMPLYNRVSHPLELKHLDIRSIIDILTVHAECTPSKLLFLWNLFEGVPKFYRDAYEQDALQEDRTELLATMFFRSSSPLRTEAENWFLSELRGQYDTVLKYIARHPGAYHADVIAHINEFSHTKTEQASGYLQALIDRFQMVERRLPIFSQRNSRKGRYYIRDNFLRSWLGALQTPVASTAI